LEQGWPEACRNGLLLWIAKQIIIRRGRNQMSKGLRHKVVVFFAMASLLLPQLSVFAQEASPQGAPAPSPGQPQAQTVPEGPVQPRRVTLGADYSAAKKWFPHFTRPYRPSGIPALEWSNSPRLDQLIQNGKLMLSLEDAISLALEDNLAIAVERYTPWLNQVNLLRAKSGVNGLVPFDPTLTGGMNLQASNTPINNPLFAGVVPTGGATPTQILPLSYSQHIGSTNFQYTQYFHSGTEIQAGLTTNRTSTNLGAFNLYNPFLQSSLTLQFTQPLLRGFGTLPNTRLIIEAKNTEKAGLSQLSQQVMATVTQVSNDYWELVYARENVKVEEASVHVSQTLYDDNKTRASIGTLSRLDVLTAQSQLAVDKQALIQAQSVQRQGETTLLNDITRNPADGAFLGIEIIPTTPIAAPIASENIRLEDAVKEAWEKRPELQQMALNLKNAAIDVKATRNELLPSVNLFAEYIATGLGGVQTSTATTPTGTFLAGAPVVDANGNPVPGFFESTALSNSSQVIFPGGIGDTLNRMIRGKYPTFEVGINFSLPIRNRAAQADNAQALLNQRLQETQYRQQQNAIFVNVRNALIALQEDRASLAAATEARSLAVQTFEAEQEKYRLGASTSYDVVLRSRDVTTAQGTELRVSINLLEDELKLNQAIGRTLEVNNITLADALRGKISGPSNIPGTPEAENRAAYR
jgi:outer membrane protein